MACACGSAIPVEHAGIVLCPACLLRLALAPGLSATIDREPAARLVGPVGRGPHGIVHLAVRPDDDPQLVTVKVIEVAHRPAAILRAHATDRDRARFVETPLHSRARANRRDRQRSAIRRRVVRGRIRVARLSDPAPRRGLGPGATLPRISPRSSPISTGTVSSTARSSRPTSLSMNQTRARSHSSSIRGSLPPSRVMSTGRRPPPRRETSVSCTRCWPRS